MIVSELNGVREEVRSTYDYVFVWKRRGKKRVSRGGKVPQVGGIDSVVLYGPIPGATLTHHDSAGLSPNEAGD